MSACQFRRRVTDEECGEEAVVVYRLLCPNCDQHMIRAYCEEHEDIVEGRILVNQRVKCTSCGNSKRSESTYTRIGAA